MANFAAIYHAARSAMAAAGMSWTESLDLTIDEVRSVLVEERKRQKARR